MNARFGTEFVMKPTMSSPHLSFPSLLRSVETPFSIPPKVSMFQLSS